jgi:hypothetical protein
VASRPLSPACCAAKPLRTVSASRPAPRPGNARRQFKKVEIDTEILADQDPETVMRRANRASSNSVSGGTPPPDSVGARVNSTHAKPSKPTWRKMIVAALAVTGSRRGSRRLPVTLTMLAKANPGPRLTAAVCDPARRRWRGASIAIADANGKATYRNSLVRSARRSRQRRRDGPRAGRWRTKLSGRSKPRLQSRAQFRPRKTINWPRCSSFSIFSHSPATPSPISLVRRDREPEPKSTSVP